MALDSLFGTPSRTERECSLNREFLAAVAAVAAVAEARAEGSLTDEEADELLRLMTALAVQAKASAMVNRFADRLSASYLSDKRIGDLFGCSRESWSRS